MVIPLSVAGTASSGDYSGVPTSVTINANTRTQTFTLNAVADSVADTGETIIISIDSDHATFPDDLTVGTPDTSTITITDDPTVTITPATATVAEGDTVTITLTLSATFNANVVIPLSVAGTAGSGDYSGVPTSVTINANTRTQTFTLNAVADSVADTGETIIISIDSDHATFPDDLTVGTPDTSTITITDDPTVTITPATATVAEGDTVTITLTLSATFNANVVIPLSVAGTAGSGDYSGVPTSVTINANTRTQTFTLNAVADSVADTGETIIISIDSDHATFPDDLTVGTPDTSTITITDVTVFYDPSSYTVAEGGTTTVTVKLSAAPGTSVTVRLTHRGSNGATGGDYTVPDPFQVTFGATDTEATFTFGAIDDTIDDDGETVDLGFGNLPDGVNAGATATVTIIDNDDPTITVFYDPTTYTVSEGGTTTLIVKLSAPPERAITIRLSHAGTNGATEDDYTVPDPFQVTFGATDTEATFTLGATDDTIDDDGETVDLGFGNLPDGVNAGATATVTIIDNDDPTITVFYDPTTYTVSEGSATTVTVKLSAPPERQVVIPLTHTPVGTTSGGDYSGVPPTVTFGATDTTRTLTFVAATDTIDDDGETVNLGFGNLPDGVNAGATATVTILDDDDPTTTVFYDPTTYTVTEGGTTTVTVKLSAPPERQLMIPLTHRGSNGATGGDYTVPDPFQVTFGATDTEATFTFGAIRRHHRRRRRDRRPRLRQPPRRRERRRHRHRHHHRQRRPHHHRVLRPHHLHRHRRRHHHRDRQAERPTGTCDHHPPLACRHQRRHRGRLHRPRPVPSHLRSRRHDTHVHVPRHRRRHRRRR